MCSSDWIMFPARTTWLMIGMMVFLVLSLIIVANPVAGIVDISTMHKHYAGLIEPRPRCDFTL